MLNSQAPQGHSPHPPCAKAASVILSCPFFAPGLATSTKSQFTVLGLLNRHTASRDSSSLRRRLLSSHGIVLFTRTSSSSGAFSNDSIPLVTVWGQEAVCHTLGPAPGSRCRQLYQGEAGSRKGLLLSPVSPPPPPSSGAAFGVRAAGNLN